MKALPNLDIAQIIDHDQFHEDAKASGKEIWLYDTKENTKSLSPYTRTPIDFFYVINVNYFYRSTTIKIPVYQPA